MLSGEKVVRRMRGFLETLYGISGRRTRRLILYIVRKLEGAYFYEETSRTIFRKYHEIEIGYGTAGYIDLGKIPRGTVFGNYCGISYNVYIFNANHPPQYFTTHALLFNPRFGVIKKDMLPRTKLCVGHDVWIGLNAIILPSVKVIGNGAIIAAGAVVTKDVDKYAIVGGNPAKLLGYRFPPDIREKIERSEWGTLSKEELIKNKQKYEDIVGLKIEDVKLIKKSTG